MLDWIVSWNLTYLVHSTIFLGAAYLVARLAPGRAPAVLDTVWKTALVGGLVTATLQTGLLQPAGLEPLGGFWRLSSEGAGRAAVELHAGSLTEAPLVVSPRVGTDLSRPMSSLGSGTALSTVSAQPVDRPLALLVPLLMTAWAVGAAALLFSLALSWYGLRRRLAGRRFLRDGVLASFLDRLIEHTPKPRPAGLAVSERIDIPLAWGLRRREICLPERMIEDMPRERQELVLAHELAHHERRDPLWLLLARVVECVWFFQPLNRVARRRLQEVAEYLCDDWAVEQTGRPVSLARCLTEVAEWRLSAIGAWPAPTLAAHRGRLARRVTRLLDRAYPLPAAPSPKWLNGVLAAGIIGVVLLGPGVWAATEEEALKQEQAEPAQTIESAPEAPPSPRAPVAMETPAPMPSPAALPLAEQVTAPRAPRTPPAALMSVTPRTAPTPRTLPTPLTPRTPSISPAPQAPISPVPQAPISPAPQAPIPPVPQAPISPVPQAPVSPAPPAPPVNAVPLVHPDPNFRLSSLALLAPPAAPASDERPAAAPRASESNGGWVVVEEGVEQFEGLMEIAPEAQARIEELSVRIAALAESAVPSPETLARIEILSERIAERSEPDTATVARIEELAERLEASDGDPQIERMLRAETAALTAAVRPNAEELRLLREEIRRELEATGPQREEIRRAQEELRHELQEHQTEIREGVRAAAELRRSDFEHLREELRRESELLGRLKREELRSLRAEALAASAFDRAELDRLRAEVDRFVEEALEIRRQLDSGAREGDEPKR